LSADGAAPDPGRHVVVTGAGSGIGRAIALRFAADGARVSLLGRRLSALEETITLGGSGGTLRAHECDLRDAGSVRAAVAGAAAAMGPVEVAIANAGIGGPNGPCYQEEGAEDRFDDLVSTNLGGTYRFFRAALEHLAPEAPDAALGGSRRHLVAVSSILARIGVAGYTGYCASKAGVSGLVRAFAAELAPLHIQVNAVAPGWVDTAMAREGLDGMAAAMGISQEEALAIAMKDVPLGRMGRPEEVAGLVAWLTSADAQGVTGQTMDMNGGAFMS
jgi:NAD(P)-dependent dehydrogenase (short-subunit alcohol dehydrogenase family)